MEKKRRKNLAANSVMVAIIAMILVGGVLGVGYIRGWFGDRNADTAVLADVRGIVNMTELTRETIHQLTPAAEKNRQTITEEVQEEMFLYGDRSKLSQILYNLMDNAIKYTPEDGQISVSLREEDGNVVWRVRDNGIGIPEEDQEHIFERFYRVDKARGRETGGTGLGLSIVKQMVRMHDGTITVRSTPGKGSEFVVTFPQEGEEA